MSEFPVLRGRSIRVDENGLVCLSDIWSAAGFSVNQKPAQWWRLPSTPKLAIALLEKMGKSHRSGNFSIKSVYYTKTGRGGAAFAHPVLAVSYAEYLSAKLSLEVKEVFLRYKAADPTLADEILARATPEANEWAGKRALGRVVRRRFTDVLKAHGVKNAGFGQCTNVQYIALFDRNAQTLKMERGVTASGSLRDSMETRELVTVAFAEQLASSRIEEEVCQGNKECAEASSKSAKFVREAIERDKADRQRRRIV